MSRFSVLVALAGILLGAIGAAGVWLGYEYSQDEEARDLRDHALQVQWLHADSTWNDSTLHQLRRLVGSIDSLRAEHEREHH